MKLSDNETKFDLLNKESMANVIVETIRDKPDQPKTIGVHGSWGSGKSSILMMISDRLSNEEDIVCIKFNGWRIQGFGDAKISIIEEIVSELIEKRPLLVKAGNLVKDTLKRLDWIKVAKLGTNFAMNFTAEVPKPDQLKSMFGKSSESSENSSQPDYLENLVKYFDILKENTSGDSKKIPQEIKEFHKAFDALVNQAKIEQLVVLIDDLDRCLPKTVVEILEAIRLFLFTKRTVFVIAADEELVEMSVSEHFPQHFESLPKDYSSNYLEKLIQMPFHIRTLGETESRIYVTLLLIGFKLGEDNKNYRNLVEKSTIILQKPWERNELDEYLVKKTLDVDFESVRELYSIGKEISPIIAKGTKGTPRQIKRFLNDLFVRMEIATKRGFDFNFEFSVLSKLMLAERFQTELFQLISKTVSQNSYGFSEELSILERDLRGKSDNLALEIRKLDSYSESISSKPEFWTAEETIDWLNLEPSLRYMDLRPYLYILNVKSARSMNTNEEGGPFYYNEDGSTHHWYICQSNNFPSPGWKKISKESDLPDSVSRKCSLCSTIDVL